MDDKELKELKAARAVQHQKDLSEAPALSASDILGKPKTIREWVLVPEWGGKVLVRSLSGTERDSFEGSLVIKRGKTRDVTTENIRAKLVQKAIVDQNDPDQMKPAFTVEQVADLGALNAAALNRVYEVASRLSGLSEEDVEELAGN